MFSLSFIGRFFIVIAQRVDRYVDIKGGCAL